MQQGRSDDGRQCGNAWSGLENKSQEVGSKRKTRRMKCKVIFSLILNKVCQKSYMKVVVKKLLRGGMRVRAVENSPDRKIKIEEADGSSSRQKERDLSVLVHGKENFLISWLRGCGS